MPNYYAHLRFGAAVLDRLSPRLRARLNAERPAYDVGLFGPDPLFFYRPVTRGHPHRVGVELHNQPFLPTAQALREMVSEGLPHASGYAAGSLCHFLLDSRLHPFVLGHTQPHGLSHSGMEGELDRALMTANGLDPRRDTPLPDLELPASFFHTAVRIYPGVTPEQLRKALHNFGAVCRFQTRALGSPLHGLIDRAGGAFPALAALRGSILPARPDPAYNDSTAALRALWEEAVSPAAAALEAFFDPAVPLGDAYRQDFHGALPDPAR